MLKAGFQIGFIGLGKLGLPCAAALSVELNQPVFGFDLNPQIADFVSNAKIPYVEDRAEDFISRGQVRVEASVEAVVEKSDFIFLAVQTPHQPQFEGITPVPEAPEDFGYEHLKSAVRSVKESLLKFPEKSLTLVIISTVLPGTVRNYLLPELAEVSSRVRVCYNPFFIAMGNTINDFLNPEFVLIGTDDLEAGQDLAEIYSKVHSAKSQIMQIESAELTKVAYNTFIGFKIQFANILAEIVDKRGGDVDEITSALSQATDRLISGKYLSAGMSDGGGCHPRDQIAMSWLAKDAGLSSDMFGFLARARDAYSQKQAADIERVSRESGLPVCLLGMAYKKNIGLEIGSPAALVEYFLKNLGVTVNKYDPYITRYGALPEQPHVFFIATNHDDFKTLSVPAGSIVIDPWGNVFENAHGIEVIRPGRMQKRLQFN